MVYMYKVYIESKKCRINMWPIMDHYIATSAVVFQDAVLYTISAIFRLTATSGKHKSLVSYTCLVYTLGQSGHQVSLSVTASCGETWRTETTDSKYRMEKNSRNKSGSSLTAKGVIME